MANNNLTDPTQVGIKGLSGINTEEGRKRLLEQYGLSTSIPEFKVRRATTPIELPNQEVGRVGLGDSIYDEDIVSLTQLENLEDTRGELQPWYSKIGAGLGKGAVLAGTTFLDGVAGTIVGASQALAEQNISKLWDNDFGKMMKQVNDWSEEALPNHQTEEERINVENGEGYKNMFSANWWGNSFIKNLGFTVGAFATGNLLSGIMKNAPAMVKTITGSMVSAINEGKIEALNNSTDWAELETRKVEDAYNVAKAELLQNYGNLDDIDERLSDLEVTKQVALNKIEEDKVKMGNVDLALNIPILTASNWFMWGKLYSGGAKDAIRATNIAKRNGKYISTVSPSKIITGPLSEGAEELNQKIASTIPGLYYGSEVENYYKSKWDSESAEEVLNRVQATMQGISETLADPNSWEEFAIGAMTGVMGMPMFRSAKSIDGKWQSPITLEGGMYGEYKDYKEKRDRSEALANRLNERVQSPEFLNYYQGMIRHSKYQNDMDEAAEDGDIKSFKDAEDSQLISDINMFDKAGKLNDLVEYINQAFDTSDENIESIIKNTTDENGNGVFSDNGNAKPKEEIIESLTKRKDEILQAIRSYQKVKDDVNIAIGRATSHRKPHTSKLGKAWDRFRDRTEGQDYMANMFNDDAVDELVYLRSKSGAWNNRFNKVADEVKSQLRTVIAEIEYRHPNKKDTIEELKGILQLPNELLSSILGDPKNKSNKEVLSSIASTISNSNNLEWKDLATEIDDMVKLAEAKNSFDTKFNEYLKNPEKLNEKLNQDKQDITDRAVAEELAKKQDAVNKAKSFKEVEGLESSGQLNEELVKNSTNQLVKDYKKAKRFKAELNEAIDKSDYNIEQKQALHSLAEQRFSEEQTIEDLMNSSLLTEYSIDADGEIINGGTLAPFLELAKSTMEKNDIPDVEEHKTSTESPKSTGNDNTSTVDVKDAKVNTAKLTDIVSTSVDKESVNDIVIPRINEAKQAVDKVLTDNTESNVEKAITSLNKLERVISDLPEANDAEFADKINKALEKIYDRLPKSNPDISNKELLDSTIQDRELEENKKVLEKPEGQAYEFYRSDLTPFTIDSFNDGTFIPFIQDNPSYKDVYNKIEFDYINKGNVKAGDTINLKLEKAGEYDVVFMYHNNHIVGVLPTVNRTSYKGIKGINERLAKGEEVNLTVSKIMLGRYRFDRNKTQSVKDVAGIEGNVKFGVMSPVKGHPTLVTNSEVKTEPVFDELHSDGKVYLLLPNSRGTYSPKLLRIKHFNREEFDLATLKDSTNTRAKEIHGILDAISKADNPDQIDELAGQLGRVLHTKGLLHMNMVTMGNNTVLTLHGKAGRKNIVIERGGNGAIILGEEGPTYSEPERVAPEIIYNEVLDYLYTLNPVFNVRASKVNKDNYNQDLLNDDILYTHITDAEMIGSWFTTTWYDDNGVEQKAKNPRGNFTVNNKGEGTKIVVQGRQYYVNKGVVYDVNENEVTNNVQFIKDLAYCEELYGDKINGSTMDNNMVLLPNGRAINRTTQRYLNDKETQELKDKLAGRPSKIEAANSTLKKLQEDQNKVKRDTNDKPDTSNNEQGESVYRILEEDGQYHEYKRVHSVIGSNWLTEFKKPVVSLESKANIALLPFDSFKTFKFPIKHALESQDRTSKVFGEWVAWKNSDGTYSYVANNKKIAKLQENYNANFDGHTEILSGNPSKFVYVETVTPGIFNSEGAIIKKAQIRLHETMPDVVSSLEEAESPALKWGTLVDDIAREYFGGNTNIQKPKEMSDTAFGSLMKRLSEVKSHLKRTGERFLVNRIVVFKKLPDGTRVAGELDALSYNETTGVFNIYDFKTSKRTFHATGEARDLYRTKGNKQSRSDYEQHSMQLSAYKNMFDASYPSNINSLWIMPFVLEYNGAKTLDQVRGEQTIPLVYKPEVINTGKIVMPTVPPVTDPTKAAMNPKPASETVTGETSYFELNGEVVTAPTTKIGEVNGYEIRMYKESQETSGLGGTGAGTLNRYYAVFPNGNTFKFIDLSPTTEEKAADIIMKGLKGNPARVKELSEAITKVGNYQKPDNKNKLAEAQTRLNATNKSENKGNPTEVAKLQPKLEAVPKEENKKEFSEIAYKSWEELDDTTQQVLNLSGYDSSQWNSLPPKVKEDTINCLGI